MPYYLKCFLLLVTLCLLYKNGECQELQFINEKTGRVTSFHIGDRVGYGLKNSLFKARDNGTLTGFGENFLLINEKPYELPQIKYIRHFKPGLTLLFGALGLSAALIALILGVKLLLVPSSVRLSVIIFALGIFIISLLTIELINGPRIKPDLHTVKIINESLSERSLKMNP